jgi:hypothetical protein
VGGVYHQQIALFQYHQFRSEPNSIACLALRGRVPVRAIVSRGHEAASAVFNLPPNKLSASLEGQYNFLQVTGMTAEGHTAMLNPGTVMREIISTHHSNADIYMIGTRRTCDDDDDAPSQSQSQSQSQQQHVEAVQGFNLQLVTEDTWQPRSINFAVEARLPVPDQLRFFIVNGETCARDMEQVMTLAKKVRMVVFNQLTMRPYEM